MCQVFSRAAGCRLPWDSLSDQSRPVCTSLHQFEHFARQYDAMRDASMRQILNITRCQKPCSYKKYVLISGPLEAAYTAYSHFSVELWMVTTDITSLTETLIYPWTSLVAEFGGTLGLFLGFSFMTLWDGLATLGKGWAAVKTYVVIS